MLLEEMFINIDMEQIPKYTKIAGISFYDRQMLIKNISVGDILQLKRDYKNEHDRNAIAICVKDKNIGWIPKYISQNLAPEIDCGLKWVAKVTDITGQNEDTQGINIQLIFIDK